VKKYPDISELIKKKEEHRRMMAALPFEKKVEARFRSQRAPQVNQIGADGARQWKP